jgi:hypothetical protein
MPIYVYDCEGCGKVSDFMCQYKDRPDTIACGDCEETAVRRSLCWNPPAKPVNSHPLYGQTNPDISEKERAYIYICEEKHITVEFYSSPPAEMMCDDCELMAKREVGANLDMHWARYPYFDRGLGCIVKSERHRREVAKSMGLTLSPFNWDMEGAVAKLSAQEEKEKQEYRDYYNRVNNDPAYKDYWKARDQGLQADMLPPSD